MDINQQVGHHIRQIETHLDKFTPWEQMPKSEFQIIKSNINDAITKAISLYQNSWVFYHASIVGKLKIIMLKMNKLNVDQTDPQMFQQQINQLKDLSTDIKETFNNKKESFLETQDNKNTSLINPVTYIQKTICNENLKLKDVERQLNQWFKNTIQIIECPTEIKSKKQEEKDNQIQYKIDAIQQLIKILVKQKYAQLYTVIKKECKILIESFIESNLYYRVKIVCLAHYIFRKIDNPNFEINNSADQLNQIIKDMKKEIILKRKYLKMPKMRQQKSISKQLMSKINANQITIYEIQAYLHRQSSRSLMLEYLKSMGVKGKKIERRPRKKFYSEQKERSLRFKTQNFELSNLKISQHQKNASFRIRGPFKND